MLFVPEQMFVLFGSYLNRCGACWASLDCFGTMLGALGMHGKRQGAKVGATNRMVAVQVDQNPATNDVAERTSP